MTVICRGFEDLARGAAIRTRIKSPKTATEGSLIERVEATDSSASPHLGRGREE